MEKHNSSHKTIVRGGQRICQNPNCEMFGLPVGEAASSESLIAKGIEAIKPK